jgi:hypothetical protein
LILQLLAVLLELESEMMELAVVRFYYGGACIDSDSGGSDGYHAD